jgi:hypothetical protein
LIFVLVRTRPIPADSSSHRCLDAGLANGQTAYNSIADLEGTTFGISRLGSGSQVMASVLSMNEKWSCQPKFKGEQGLVGRFELTVVNGQFKPLRDSVNSGESRSDISICS